MKEVLIAAAALIICTAMPAAVSADVIVEPADSFYNSHSGEIETNSGRNSRRFELAAETKVYNDPNGKAVGKLSAGISPYISYYYTDKSGVKWGGYFDYSGDDELLWIPVDGLDYVYDNYSFEEEHKDEITDGGADEYASYRTDKTTDAVRHALRARWNTLRVLRKGGWPTRVDKKIFMKITENL